MYADILLKQSVGTFLQSHFSLFRLWGLSCNGIFEKNMIKGKCKVFFNFNYESILTF